MSETEKVSQIVADGIVVVLQPGLAALNIR